MPKLKVLYEKLPRSRFDIIGVTSDESEEVLKKYLVKFAIPWPECRKPDEGYVHRLCASRTSLHISCYRKTVRSLVIGSAPVPPFPKSKRQSSDAAFGVCKQPVPFGRITPDGDVNAKAKKSVTI